MTNKQQNLLCFVVGVATGTALFYRSKTTLRAAMDDFANELRLVYTASGTVAERARQGKYANHEEAEMDFEFERIRLGAEDSD